VTSKYIRSSRTSVPVTMGSSISTRTKQRGNSENVRSTQLNESIERFLNCLDIYIGLPRCWYSALLGYVQTDNVNPYSCSSTLFLRMLPSTRHSRSGRQTTPYLPLTSVSVYARPRFCLGHACRDKWLITYPISSYIFSRYLRTDCGCQQRLGMKHRIRCESKY
jgi:hypothetical protein